MAASALGAAFAVYGGRLTSALAQAIALVLLAREVAPESLGVVTIAVALVSLAGLLADLGMETSSVRTLAAGDRPEAANTTRFHFRAMLLAAVAVGAVLLALHQWAPDLVPASFLLLAPWIAVERRNNLRISLTVAVGEERRAGTSLGTSRLVALVAYAGLAGADFVSPQVEYFTFLIVSALLSQLLLRKGLGDVLGGVGTDTSYKSAVRIARPYWLASLSGQARTMDTVVLGALGSPAMAGLYALPARAVGPLRLAATSISVVAMPRAARGDWAQVRALERGMWGCLVLFVGLIAAIAMWGEEVLVAILGAEYAGAGAILTILMLGVMVNIPGALWSGVLQGSGRQHTVAKIGLWLVPAFYLFIIAGLLLGGAQGAAWGVSATFLLQFLIMLRFRLFGHWGQEA
ncbi:lipopolysaccharide biosynthesis protein [Nocardioides gilvus]|uniref:lipopolysaccharide biosynthesis protein n=1 Tax=Nocardioides gilvus TaxID=1735589 RepID=UPI0013A5A7C9|nr:oligosaccharide flippase family protein [Nocardioides gilvus]